MSRYAEHTSVAVERSRTEIERTLQRYGCDDFAYRSTAVDAQIAFRIAQRTVRFILPLPNRADEQFTMTTRRGSQVARTDLQALEAWEQACRQRWRALALCIKAKLEAVEAGISTFESEFLAHIVIPDGKGKTVGEWLLPQLQVAYETKRTPSLLLEGPR